MKILFLDHNQVLTDIRKQFEETKDINEADRVVVWSDVTSFERGVVELAKRKGIPTITVQHGRRGTSRYFSPFNEPITSDKLFVWGEADKQALVDAGHDGKKIKVTGTTVLSHLKPRTQHDGINVVFCPEHWDKEIEENLKVMSELSHLPYHIVSKLIEGHNPKNYLNPVISHRNSPDHLDICAEVLSTADIVVGISESTFELMAQVLDIPVVIVDEWNPKSFGGDERYTQGYRRIVSNASTRTSVENLKKTIKQQLAHPEILSAERKLIAISEGGINLHALDTITKEIIVS